MDNNYILERDKIIATAIELLDTEGMSSVTFKNLAKKLNMTEMMLYRYFGSLDEIMVEVVNTFTKLDDRIIASVEAMEISHLDKIQEYLKLARTDYTDYGDFAILILNFEDFLHNTRTRDQINIAIQKRVDFGKKEFEAAIKENEIVDYFTAEELSNIFFGCLWQDMLNRRVWVDDREDGEVKVTMISKLAKVLKKNPDQEVREQFMN